MSDDIDRASHATLNRAWHKAGIIVLRVDDIRDDELRKSATAYAERKYGKRGN